MRIVKNRLRHACLLRQEQDWPLSSEAIGDPLKNHPQSTVPGLDKGTTAHTTISFPTSGLRGDMWDVLPRHSFGRAELGVPLRAEAAHWLFLGCQHPGIPGLWDRFPLFCPPVSSKEGVGWFFGVYLI